MHWLQYLSVDNGVPSTQNPLAENSHLIRTHIWKSNRIEKEEKEEEEKKERFDFHPNESTATLIEETATSTNKIPNAVSHAHTPQAHKRMSVSFRQALLSSAELKSDSRIGVEDPKLDAVNVFARCLPPVVPNVSLAKREVSMC